MRNTSRRGVSRRPPQGPLPHSSKHCLHQGQTQKKWPKSLAGLSLSCRRQLQIWCHNLRLGQAGGKPKMPEISSNAPNKQSWICETPEEVPVWRAVRGLEPTGGSAFVPFVSFPLEDLGLWKVFYVPESFPCLVGKGKSHKLELASVAAPSC